MHCDAIKKEIHELIEQGNGELLALANRKVELVSTLVTSDRVPCTLNMVEEITVKVGTMVFSKTNVSYIRDLEGLTSQQCRQLIPDEL